LAALLPLGWELWLDGGHNPAAGEMLARHVAGWADRPTHVVVGIKTSKDQAGFLRPLLPVAASLWAVQEPGQHLAMPIAAIIAASEGRARPGPTVAAALRAISAEGGPPARVLICGSLHLAGEVLKQEAGG
jgi:dihydrofolate synthase/folylpolyglutamate synthase